MKILHFADLHLGVESYGHIDTDGLSTRLKDFLAAFDQLVEYALGNRVDLVLFCGDAYKSREPSQTQQREFARRINRLATAGIPVFLLVGNHDLPNAMGKATTTEIFDTLAIANVYVSNRPDIYRIPTRSGPIQIASLPWLRRSALLSKEKTKDLGFDQINQKIQEVLTNIVAAHAARLDPTLPAILAAHVWVTGARIGSERSMTIGHEPALLLSNVANPAFDYIALGHIHKHQVLADNPPVVYAGSLQPVDFGEEGDEKGFSLIDIEPESPTGRRLVSLNFQPVSGRNFLTIKVNIQPEDSDPTATILRAIHTGGTDRIKGSMVRLQIGLPAGIEGQLRDNDIRAALKEADYLTVAKDIQRETRSRLGQLTAEEITPLEALKTYLEAKKYPPAQARVLLQYGEKLIQQPATKD